MAKRVHVPKIGKEVLLIDHIGSFRVKEVDAEAQSASVIALRNGVQLDGISWGIIVPFSKSMRENFSRTAARIVREATEKD